MEDRDYEAEIEKEYYKNELEYMRIPSDWYRNFYEPEPPAGSYKDDLIE